MNRDTPLDPGVKKSVLRLFTYGLYAVGVARGDERNLFTANWLTQVSFDPPLLALSVENDGHSIELIRENGVFAISIFKDGDAESAGLLGKRWKLRPDKIQEVDYRLGVTGCPVLKEALAAVECRVMDSVPAGDSTLFVGEVIHAEMLSVGAPLTMAEAGFRHAG
ncbi:MAG: flavin reductase family protein [Chloroflexota bacterium]